MARSPSVRDRQFEKYVDSFAAGGYGGDCNMTSINHADRIREKWQRGELCVGANVHLSDAAICELYGEVGFDIAWIDMEHSAMTIADTANHIRACRAGKVAPFVRVPSQDPVVIKPYLELHPAGIIIPRITGVEDAEEAVSACRYPPRGTRGFGPGRGMRWGGRSLDDYLQSVDEEILVILQIEHIDAVNTIDDILAIPGMDSIVPGPNDLAATMGQLGNVGHADVQAALHRLADACRAKGVPMGQSIGFEPETFQTWVNAGISWICCDGDMHLIAPAARRMHEQMRSLAKPAGR